MLDTSITTSIVITERFSMSVFAIGISLPVRIILSQTSLYFSFAGVTIPKYFKILTISNIHLLKSISFVNSLCCL